jgi:RNA polymerase sigma factor (sigma-70 family)
MIRPVAAALFRSSTASSFDGLYRRHVASVYRYAFAVVGNHADAEDITQQTFLNAYRAMSQGTTPRKAENWLLTIAHNEVRRHFRESYKKGHEVEFDEELAPPAPERSDPGVADVLRALRHIPPAQRSALVMREFEGRSYAEIAGIMGLSERALETLIFRARRSLAEQLEGALTCDEAEDAFMRRLDGRLPRRESRRLRRHVKECLRCARFGRVQKQQRSLLKGLSVMPVPASIFLFRGETAAAAGGTTSVAAGAGATGVATGLVAKAAAITAAAVVAGGVGYEVAVAPQPAAKLEPKAAQRAEGRPGFVRAAAKRPLVLRTKVGNGNGAGAVVVRSAARKRAPIRARVSRGHAKVEERQAVAGVGSVKTPPGQTKVKTSSSATGAGRERPVKTRALKAHPVRSRPVRKAYPAKAKPARPVLEKTHPAKPVKPPPPPAAQDRVKPDRPVDPSATAPEPKKPPQEEKADQAGAARSQGG